MFYKKICGIAAGLLLVCSVASAHDTAAEGTSYGGLGYAAVDYSIDDFQDFSFGIAYGKIGTWFTKNIAGELRVGLGVLDDTYAIFPNGETVDINLDSVLGTYIRVGASADSTFAPYLIGGYTRTTLSIEGAGFNADDSQTDISFGVGADIAALRDSVINIEYMNYYDETEGGINAKLTAVGIMFMKQF